MQLYIHPACADRPNRYIWLNGRTFWCKLTFRRSDGSSDRMEFNLKTHDVEVARRRRDRMIADIQAYLSTNQTTTT